MKRTIGWKKELYKLTKTTLSNLGQVLSQNLRLSVPLFWKRQNFMGRKEIGGCQGLG